jgi:hypothetical protein
MTVTFTMAGNLASMAQLAILQQLWLAGITAMQPAAAAAAAAMQQLLWVQAV